MKRDFGIDACKGMLILLVVLGHTIGQAIALEGVGAHVVLAEINRGIYLFHVPAFFVVAGLVWKSSSDSFLTMLEKRFKRLIVPYLAFGMFSIVLYSIAIEKSFAAIPKLALSLLYASGWGGAFKANSPLWFLPCMFTACIVYWVIDKLLPWNRFKWIHVAFAPCLYFAYRWLLGAIGPEALPFGVVVAFRLMPCIVVGRMAALLIAENVRSTFEAKRVFIWVGVFACCLIATHGVDVLQGTRIIGNRTWGFLWWMLSLFASVAALVVFRAFRMKWLCLFGIHSMGVMLIHKFVVVAVGRAMPICLWPVVFVLAAVGSLAASIVISRFCPVLLGSRRT